MCINPRTIPNPHYYDKKQKMWKPNTTFIKDQRLKYVEIPCTKCKECRQKRATEWKIRILEEFKHNGFIGQFVTLTISEEEGEKIEKLLMTNENLAIAKLMIKRFRERWRKKFGTSPKHFFICELGHKNTERLHIHGILFEPDERFGTCTTINPHNKKKGYRSENLEKLWKYGNTSTGYTKINEATINYVSKYITKHDEQHPGYYSRILVSPGIGKQYINDQTKQKHQYKGENGKDTYTKYKHKKGTETGLPIYYKRKLWTDWQRENLRINYENEEYTYIAGQKIPKTDIKKIAETYQTQINEHTRLKLWSHPKRPYAWRNIEEVYKHETVNNKQIKIILTEEMYDHHTFTQTNIQLNKNKASPSRAEARGWASP